MKKISSIILALTFTVAFGLGLVSTETPSILTGDNFSQLVSAEGNVAYADGGSQSVFEGENIDASEGDSGEAGDLIKKLKQAANIFAAIVLVVSIIMIIVGALKYILSSGNQQQAAEAKMVLIYSGVGIIVALSAFALGRLFAYFGF